MGLIFSLLRLAWSFSLGTIVAILGLVFSLLRLPWSISWGIIAAILRYDAKEAEKEIGSEGVTGTLAKDPSPDNKSDVEVESDGGVGLTGHLAQDTSSDSDLDTDVDSDGEDEDEFGGDIWVHDKYLAYLRKPKDIDIICYCHNNPGNIRWSAKAPEWPVAIGYGTSIEEASEDLQDSLEDDKLTAIEGKRKAGIKKIPLNPSTMSARKVRMGYWDGFYIKWRKRLYDEAELRSNAVVWGKIRV